jgi:PAS domain S-box-containing protein
MKWKTEVKIANIGFVITLIILLSLGFLCFQIFQRDLEKENRTKHTYQVLQTSKELLSSIKDGETGQRGYIITANNSFLIPYYISLKQNGVLLTKLKGLTADNSHQQKRCDTLEQLLNIKYEYLKLGISTRKESGASAAVTLIKKGGGKRIMDEIRIIFEDLENEEQTLLVKREADSEKAEHLMRAVILSGIIMGVLIFIGIYFKLRSQINKGKIDESELFIRNEWLTQTLASLCDGVIATDTEGIITMINRAGSEISGWENEEAIGKYIDTVFKITDEDTGAKMISPTIKALQTNHVVLLSNHTILRRKDGTILFIDDSGAPIHNQDSDIIGAILIFRDITEKKKAEQLIVASNIRFTKIFDLSPIATCISGLEDQKFMYANNAFCDTLGFKREEVIGKRSIDLEITSKDWREKIHGKIINGPGQLHGVEVELKRSDSEKIEVLGSFETIEIDNKTCLLTSFIDISEQKLIQKQIDKLHFDLEIKNKELVDSIHYAKRIQTALMTNENYMELNLNRLIK